MRKSTITSNERSRKNRKPLCLVITGAMNPPTLAHVRVAESCADFMTRATGRHVIAMFAPACQADVEKTANGKEDAVLFPEEMRADMLMSLIERNGMDASVTNCEMGEDRGSSLVEIIDMLYESDPSMDYMPVIGQNHVKKFARLDGAARIAADHGLLIAVKDAHRCRDGHGRKQLMRETVENDEILAPFSSRIYITDRTDLDEMPNSSSNARKCIANGDYDGTARECGYYVTRMIDAYRETGTHEPARDWYNPVQ